MAVPVDRPRRQAQVIRRGSAVTYNQKVESERGVSAPAKLAKDSNLGTFKVMACAGPVRTGPRLSSGRLEMGTGSEVTLKKVRGMLKLKGDEKEELSDAIDQFLTGQTRGNPPPPQGLAGRAIPGLQQGGHPGGLLQDDQSKQEGPGNGRLPGEGRAVQEGNGRQEGRYDATVQKVAMSPNRRSTLFGAWTKRFEGTEYGKRAADAAEEKQK